jgi:4-diphosphocytidyl-2-C-methyl-D-erythritol kinase
MRVQALAKLNLFLRIVGRREDGFHELETVFQSIDLADELSFASADDLQLTGGSDAAAPGPENLVLRAAAALRAATGYAGGASIQLEKQIPVGAGLGGGSSDAAATLVALNHLWELNLSRERLAGLAAALGSDVPFFLHGGTRIGRGRGEILEPIPGDEGYARDAGTRRRDEKRPSLSGYPRSGCIPHPSSLTFVLVQPPFPVATARAYTLYRPAPSSAPTLEAFLEAFATGDPECLARRLRNDLETGVFAGWPELAALREELLAAGAVGARMTGSGSVLFGLARDERHAQQIAERMARPGLWVRAVRAIDPGVQVFRCSGVREGDPEHLNTRTPEHLPEGDNGG